MFKFVVMSDLHIVPRGALSNGLDSSARLEQAIAHVNARHSDAEFCVFAGDLTDNGDTLAYDRLSRKLAHLELPFYLTLGNHDDRQAFLEVFGEGYAAASGRIDDFVDHDGYRVILLDSLQDGTDAGGITPAQIEWLRAVLAESAGRPAIVILHHNICPLGVPTDFICLQDPGPLLAALRAHGNVRQVISGHVHMSASGVCEGIPFSTISGNHYEMFPDLRGPLSEVPRLDGPGQIGVVLAGPDRVVVHRENFFDRHQRQPAHLHGSRPEDAVAG